MQKDKRSLAYRYTQEGKEFELTELETCNADQITKRIAFHVEQLAAQGHCVTFRKDHYQKKSNFISLPPLSYKLINALKQHGDIKSIAKANGLTRETLRLQFNNNSFRPQSLKAVLKHYNLSEEECLVA